MTRALAVVCGLWALVAVGCLAALAVFAGEERDR